MSNCLVSVVLPVKNGQDYISAAIDSILCQTLSNLELILIDNGSIDNTPNILRAYAAKDSRVRHLSCESGGLVEALNFGITAASADLIARMDADDIAAPNRLEVQYHYLQSHPEIAVVGSQVRFIDADGYPLGQSTHYPETPAGIRKTLLKFCCLRHPTVMMRRDAFEAVGGYRASFIAAEDYDLWLRIAERYEIVNLPEPLLLYRLHGQQVTQQKKWRQRLSRNLTLLSAQKRRKDGADPLASFACFDAAAAIPACKNCGCHADVCQTVRAFNAAQKLFNGVNDIPKDEVVVLLKYLARNTIGDGQSIRLKLLVKLCRLAIESRAPDLFARALVMAVFINPSRTFRWLFWKAAGIQSLWLIDGVLDAVMGAAQWQEGFLT